MLYIITSKILEVRYTRIKYDRNNHKILLVKQFFILTKVILFQTYN